MKTRRFDLNFQPLMTSNSLEIVGSIPNSQQYDAITGEYIPDYSLVDSDQRAISPLVFQPHVYAHDKDGVIPDGEVTKSLTNMVWKWIEVDANGTTTTTITTTSSDFIIDTSSTDTRGRLTIKKNVPVNKQVSVVFDADFLDPRTGQACHAHLTERVRLENVSETIPEIMVDRKPLTLWHPCRDNYNYSISARLLRGSRDFPTAQRTFTWEKHRANGSWSAIGSDTYDDIGFSISQNGATFNQDMRYMGDKLEMRVRAAYTGHALDDSSPCVYFTIVRRIPEFDYDFVGAPDDISPDTDVLYLRAIITDKDGVIPNPANEFDIQWKYANKPAAGTDPTFIALGSGEYMSVRTTPMANTNEMTVGIDPKDRGARKEVVDANGKIVLDANGKVVFDR